MNRDRYIIQGGQPGKTRLGLLASVLQPTTQQLFERVGLTSGMHCLDVGCGGGAVTLEMARHVGAAGRVHGYDFDAEILHLARRDAEEEQLNHVEFHVADATNYQAAAHYDVVYARFLLTHLPDPVQGLAGMIGAAKPGGKVVVEDIDFSGRFCYPPHSAFQRYLELYTQVAHHRGGDPYIGMKLAAMFHDAGLEDVQVNLIQPVHLNGEGKRIAQVTMERISDAVVNHGIASQAEVEEVVSGLASLAADPRTLLSLPRIFQVWGRRARES